MSRRARWGSAEFRALFPVLHELLGAASLTPSWLLNHESALTEKEASHDATFIRDYAWAFEDAGCKIPIDLTAHYSIAREANGNTTLCHRSTGEVLLFAPDHAFDFVTPLEGCPEYTLYRIHGAPDLRHWVHAVARQWQQGR